MSLAASKERTSDTPTAISGDPSWRWLREPLVHFLFTGFAIFLFYDLRRAPEVAADSVPPVSRRIEISEAKLRELMFVFEQNKGRMPAKEELSVAADDWVREEILARSALLAGLDRNDPVIRQRLVKLMQWYLTGSNASGEPSEEELRRHFEANQERYRTANSVVFEQIYFSTAKRGPTALTDANTVLASFQAGIQTGLEVAIGHGDSMGGDKSEEEMQRGNAEEFAAKFGKPFTDTLLKLPFDRWTGPYQSPVGWHVVRRHRPENPTFEEMRLKVRSEVLAARLKVSPESGFEALRKRYDVEIFDLGGIPEVQK